MGDGPRAPGDRGGGGGRGAAIPVGCARGPGGALGGGAPNQQDGRGACVDAGGGRGRTECARPGGRTDPPPWSELFFVGCGVTVGFPGGEAKIVTGEFAPPGPTDPEPTEDWQIVAVPAGRGFEVYAPNGWRLGARFRLRSAGREGTGPRCP